MKTTDIIAAERIQPALQSTDKASLLAEMGALLSSAAPSLDPGTVTKVLAEREQLATTGIGEGVAIPHGKIDRLDGVCAAVGVSRQGIPFDSVDGNPVHIVVALLAPSSSSGDHLRALARISRLLKDTDFRTKLLAAEEPAQILQAFREADEAS